MTVDIGTSSIRVSLFDLQGNVIGRKSAEAFAPAQFDAEEQLEKMLSLMRQVRETYSSIEVVRICTSTLVSWTFTGKDGMAITPVYTFGVFFVVLNYIYLSFMQIHTIFYFNYINYSGLLIFCCQNVAIFLL